MMGYKSPRESKRRCLNSKGHYVVIEKQVTVWKYVCNVMFLESIPASTANQVINDQWKEERQRKKIIYVIDVNLQTDRRED